MAFGGISQAVVTPQDDTLAGYVSGNAPIDTERLRAHLARTLPEAMVPSSIQQIDAVPLTPNKKIDRKALPAAVTEVEVDTSDTSFEETPSSPIAAKIAAIWSRTLGLQSVRAQDNFFDLGGHSLLAVQVHREIRETLNMDHLPITDIFRFPTLGGLAEYISAQTKAANDDGQGGDDSGENTGNIRDDGQAAIIAANRAETMSKRRAMRAQRARGG